MTDLKVGDTFTLNVHGEMNGKSVPSQTWLTLEVKFYGNRLEMIQDLQRQLQVEEAKAVLEEQETMKWQAAPDLVI